ncbi:CRISPR-associated endonuclease Cas2 [Halomonas sp. 25-S5]|uniref:CRISPR-associated endonuclease Cas2 n=1 Tax=Halomonas sp. 25-S5 TaxID=2994065 RepID=UPI002468888B|nr:CRISPR-associated endonuclease Cas2 [Halomonas sp. 25-S5]
MNEHIYIVTYDISDQRRWRKIFRLMKGYGEWLQLSVFQCRLSSRRHAELVATLDEMIHHEQDHVVIMDVGLAENIKPRITSLGKADYEPVTREPTIV